MKTKSCGNSKCCGNGIAPILLLMTITIVIVSFPITAQTDIVRNSKISNSIVNEKELSQESLQSNTWTDMTLNQTAKPSPRSGHAMAYDSKSDRTILFGGYTSDFNNETWTYSLSSNTWLQMYPGTKPPARWFSAMVYDSESDRTILFGGSTMEHYFNDTWAYDLNTNNWTMMKPSYAPSPRLLHAMVYDSKNDNIILFGGGVGNFSHNDTWIYTYNNNTWLKSNPPRSNPSSRIGHTMNYDSASNRVILFGGYTSLGYNAETWMYDYNANRWTNMTLNNHPSARYKHAMTYDSDSDRTVLFGGTNSQNDDTWIYNLNTNTWLSMTPSIHPSARSGHTMVYNFNKDRILLFGGEDGYLHCDTWVYITPASPSYPLRLRASPGDSEILLTWSPSSSNGGIPITNYSIYRGNSSGTETLLTSVGNVTNYTDKGLTNGQTYYYQISATNAIGEGNRSNEVSATPQKGQKYMVVRITSPSEGDNFSSEVPVRWDVFGATVPYNSSVNYRFDNYSDWKELASNIKDKREYNWQFDDLHEKNVYVNVKVVDSQMMSDDDIVGPFIIWTPEKNPDDQWHITSDTITIIVLIAVIAVTFILFAVLIKRRRISEKKRKKFEKRVEHK